MPLSSRNRCLAPLSRKDNRDFTNFEELLQLSKSYSDKARLQRMYLVQVTPANAQAKAKMAHYQDSASYTRHLNLLKITAIISSTKTVIIAIVIIRFVAILRYSLAIHVPHNPHHDLSAPYQHPLDRAMRKKGDSYLLAIPLKVLILLSV